MLLYIFCKERVCMTEAEQKAAAKKFAADWKGKGDGNIGTEHCQLSDVKGAVIGFYRKGREKLDRTDGNKWKIYSWIWTHLFPIRRYLLGFYRRIWIPIFGTI